ncbi:MAG: TIGR03960 family B12-binding radical SAM protein [Deltaproteobacteria bacterium]|nr:TIGR03960 family B12-binding radical SAM protein [Deltaproteobacteria bacterium]
MSRQSLEDILPLVQHPSHYLGMEINAKRKEPEKIRLHFALAFPDLYPIGMSHVGIQILYHILNAREGVAAERVFAPAIDLEAKLQAGGIPLASLESGTPLSDFDIVGFSLLYELNYTGVLSMLALSGIPFYGRDRDMSHPFIIAGGPCTFNPEPMADFFDAMVVGDGEEVVLDLVAAWLEWQDAGGERQALLEKWSKLQGVYVPSFFEAHVDPQGFQVLRPRLAGYGTVRKSQVSDLREVPYPDDPVIAFGTPVHDRASLEICRGCTRGCRFCQAGMIYRPVRERSCGDLLSLAERTLASTGYDDISLLSLSTGDYSGIEILVEELMNRCEPDRVAVSLPSLRVGSLTESLMSQIKRVRKTGFTIAPEAGSERLRDVINKNITEEDLEETVQSAFGLGWQRIKLYFMIGLPTETDADLDAIVELVRRLQKVRPSGGRGGNVTVSVSTFIPKAHTPFQWSPQMSVDESRRKIVRLRDQLRGKGLRFKWQSPEISILEGLWARGDRRLSRLLVKAYEMGCRLDGWSDHFQYELWQDAIEACGIDVDFYTTRVRDLSEPLPWDHIDSGVSKEFLRQEWEKALEGLETPDCRHGECSFCGVCDFEVIKPITFEADAKVNGSVLQAKEEGPFKKLRVSYEKRGPSRYFGHLEMVRIFLRAFKRAKIPLRFSQGFHPAPKVSFEAALPVGTESLEEHFMIQVPLHVSRETIVKAVNAELPKGLKITACDMGVRSAVQTKKRFHYTVTLRDDAFSKDNLRGFLEQDAWLFSKRNRKGRTRTIDLKTTIKKLTLPSERTAEIILEEGEGAGVRPKDVLDSIFGLSEETIRLATIIKRPADVESI